MLSSVINPGEYSPQLYNASETDLHEATGKVITSVAAGSAKDVDIATEAAKKAYKTSWGLKVPGTQRARLLNKLADLLEAHTDEFAALEALDVGRSRTSKHSEPLSLGLPGFEG